LEVAELDKTPPEKAPHFSEEMIQECLRIIESGDAEDLFEIIPRLGVLRDPRFHKPLISMLAQKDAKRCEFAACAMGAMGDREFLGPLKTAFLEAQKIKGFGAQDCLLAVIEAIGEIGDDSAADFFFTILNSAEAAPHLRMLKWIIESLGAIAQQGGIRSLEVLREMTEHGYPELRAHALLELAVAYWHRPNEIEDAILNRIYGLTKDKHTVIAESAVAALQSLADVGCRRAEKLFSGPKS
jgi:HEAT repeat protein